MIRVAWGLGLAAVAAASLVAGPQQNGAFFPVDDVRPGMVGIGRTVFGGDQIEEFQVNIVGVLRNAAAPQRDLVLARLEGGPLARTGVIQGMSGSPVYLDGRLLGAVAYALGSFPKEALAGITPIGEMTGATSVVGPRTSPPELTLRWPASASEVFGALERLAALAVRPVGGAFDGWTLTGPSPLAELAPALRPIGAAMVLNGTDPSLDARLRRSLGLGAGQATPQAPAAPRNQVLRPGDPVGMALVRGDLEMGATGTVTYVDGNRVYAFGHPFLNLGPTSMAMTRANVFTVLPSLDSSMKIAALGPVVGAMTQDRATAVAGLLGNAPPHLEVTVSLSSDRMPERRLRFEVLHDQTLTPLFGYVAVINTLAAFERQSGALSLEIAGEVGFGDAGTVTIDDMVAGDGPAPAAAAIATAAVGAAATNEFRPMLATNLSLTVRATERERRATIERAWLDTTQPKPGATHQLSVLLRDYRGGSETVTLPVTIPPDAVGTMTLFVSDGPSLTALEDRELRPGVPASWPELLDRLKSARRNNRVYVRLLSNQTGTVVGGRTLPALPASVRSVFDEDKSVTTAAVARTVVGAWEHRVDRVVRGSREIALTVAVR